MVLNFRLQTECSHYRTIAEEAYKHLTDILNKDVLSQSMNVRLTDWLELMEEVCSTTSHRLLFLVKTPLNVVPKAFYGMKQ